MYSKADFIYEPEHDRYRCPAGEHLIHRHRTFEHGMTMPERYQSQGRLAGSCQLQALVGRQGALLGAWREDSRLATDEPRSCTRRLEFGEAQGAIDPQRLAKPRYRSAGGRPDTRNGPK
jgi:hypothetical protein